MIRLSVAAGILSGAVAMTALAEEPAPPPAVAPNTEPDWVISHNARRALWSDPGLSELNLGVRVRHGEAFIWGPVPTEEMAAEAVARVRLVNGVKNVVSEIYILPADDLLRRKLVPTEPQRPTRPVSVTPPWDGKAVAQLGRPEPVKPIPSRLVDRVDEIRNRQLRFRSLQVEVANGIVTVTTARNRAGDAMDFAEAVKQLPGVTNVVLRSTP